MKRIEYLLKARIFKEIKSVVKRVREARIEGVEKLNNVLEG